MKIKFSKILEINLDFSQDRMTRVVLSKSTNILSIINWMLKNVIV